MTETPSITFLGQSGFLLEYNDSKLLIDPSNKKSGNFEGDLIFCTHKHFDHIGGAEVFLERNPTAILVCNEQTALNFAHFGERVKIVDDGDSFTHGLWNFQFTKLRHGIFKGIHNLGAVISAGDFSFAHCGDAVEFHNFPTTLVDVLAIPISGAFAAGPGKAIKMISNLDDPKPIIVPMHWLIRKPSGFCKKLHQKIPDVKCIVPVIGESLGLFE
ncbi:MAG: MBL fold metallo-hydrolase [Candidatus Thorarchaeota archaeon]